jgi:hypothetical protein
MMFRRRRKGHIRIVILPLLCKAALILEPIGDALITPTEMRLNGDSTCEKDKGLTFQYVLTRVGVDQLSDGG